MGKKEARGIRLKADLVAGAAKKCLGQHETFVYRNTTAATREFKGTKLRRDATKDKGDRDGSSLHQGNILHGKRARIERTRSSDNMIHNANKICAERARRVLRE